MTGGEREVVKLDLGEGQPTLNVLPVGLEGETLTLVCPFPVLPIEVPVSVTLPGDEGLDPVEATIHRVGVELMGEAQIPRFKLQLQLHPSAELEIPITIEEEDQPLRADDLDENHVPSVIVVDELSTDGDDEQDDSAVCQASVEERDRVDEPEEEDDSEEEEQVRTQAGLFDAFDNFEDPDEESVSAMPDENAETESESESKSEDLEDEDDGRISWDPPELSWSAGEFFGKSDKNVKSADWDEADTLETGLDEDPPWAETSIVPSTEMNEPRARRSRWPVRTVVTLGLIVSICAVGFVMREQIAVMIEPYLGDNISLASLGLMSQPESRQEVTAPAEAERAEENDTVAAEEASPSAEAEEMAQPEDSSQISGNETAEADDSIDEGMDELDEGPESAEATAAETEMEGSIQLAGTHESAPDPTVEENNDRLRVILPTRWPVSEARSYRLHDPTGIVIDVPGGMAAERARWIDTAHERVRSVRVLEREGGVRFIIYLNDEFVPRYRVGYSRSGVSVDILGPDPRHSTQTK